MSIKLTSLTKSSGCGCKIEPKRLDDILSQLKTNSNSPLIVGFDKHDDAAVFPINENQVLIQTLDFFTPIVDDAFTFGKIAAVNSISDIYAMGAKPILALSILGWPEDLPANLASEVLLGAQDICSQIGIPIAGGHSIESKEPFFGLSVTGFAHPNQIKKNHTVNIGDLLFLTKPIGNGIFSTALKRNQLNPDHYDNWINNMLKINKEGGNLGNCKAVSALTDVTGFGLGGHLLEMLNGYGAQIQLNSIPKLICLDEYISKFCIPDNAFRNFNFIKNKIENIDADEMQVLSLLADPQTSGGLLIAVNPNLIDEFYEIMTNYEYFNIGFVIENPGIKIYK